MAAGGILPLTCDLVSTVPEHSPVAVFQMRMDLSRVPPPVARTFCCQGHHASAWNNEPSDTPSWSLRQSSVTLTLHTPSLQLDDLVALVRAPWGCHCPRQRRRCRCPRWPAASRRGTTSAHTPPAGAGWPAPCSAWADGHRDGGWPHRVLRWWGREERGGKLELYDNQLQTKSPRLL